MSTIINFIFYSVRAGVPYMLGTTGEVINEKSGSLNLGVEGIMAVGAIIGYYFGSMTNSLFFSLLFAFLAGALCSLIYAFLTVTLHANQNVTGLALTIFGIGVYKFIGSVLMSSKTYPSLNDNKHLASMVRDNGIPFLRDIPYVGKLLFSYNLFVYIAIVVAIVAWIYIEKTKTGLRMRAVGENPGAADACGVNVVRQRYLNLLLGGGICGMGGLYLGLVTNSGAWNDAWINGAGWVSVALVIFVKWSPMRAIFGAIFFGMLNTLQPWKGNLAKAFPSVLGWLGAIPNEFYQALPFLITAIVLIISSIRKKKSGQQPAACGVNYFREER